MRRHIHRFKIKNTGSFLSAVVHRLFRVLRNSLFKRRMTAITLLAVMVTGIGLSILGTFIHPSAASAISQGDIQSGVFNFQDRGNIVGTFTNSGTVDFSDKDISDTIYNYVPAAGTFCQGSIGGDNYGIVLSGTPNWSAPTLSGKLEVGYRLVSSCHIVTRNITINNANAVAGSVFQWNGSDISSLQGSQNAETYTPTNASDVYVEYAGNSGSNDTYGNCGAYGAIILDPGSTTTGTYYQLDAGLHQDGGNENIDVATVPALSPYFQDSNGETCYVTKGPTAITIAGTIGATAPGSTAPSSGTSTGQLSCHAGFNVLNWLICGIVNGLVDVTNGLDGIINGLLAVGTPNTSSGYASQIFDTSNSTGSGAAYYNAWSSFRDLALGLMVVIGLIVIISQALGVEILDAYTIRRVLPRLIIVAIGITLSWPILSFFVELFNDLGYGVRYLIESPFSRLSFHANLPGGLNGQGVLSGVQGAAVLLASTAAIAALGIFGLLCFIGSAVLAAFIAFIVLIVRQIVVVALVITAPIALVCYILPNTQRVWRIWLDSFGGALMMFPIIAAMIATGRVFSAVAVNTAATSGSGQTVEEFIAFAAYFAPYFLIPATFKLAGGALRQIGGFVQDRGRGGFDRMRKARQASTSDRVKRARGGRLWRENWGTFGGRLGYSDIKDKEGNVIGRRQRSISRYANRFAVGTLDLDEVARQKLGTKGGRLGKALAGNYALRAEDLQKDEEWAHIAKAAQHIQQTGGVHHKAEKALAGTWAEGEGQFSPAVMAELTKDRSQGGLGLRPGEAPSTTEDMVAMAEIMKHHGTTDEISAASDLESVAGFVGNLNKDPEMYRAGGNTQALGGYLLAADGRLDPDGKATILNNMRHNPRQGPGLASRFEKQSSAVSRQRAEMAFGKDTYQTSDGEYHSSFAGDNADQWDDTQWAKAKDNVLTQKLQDLYASKGETIVNNSKVWRRLLKDGPSHRDAAGNLTGQWTNEQETARQQIFQLASRYSSTDPDAKMKVLDFMDSMGANNGPDLRSEFNQQERAGPWDPRLRDGGQDAAQDAQNQNQNQS